MNPEDNREDRTMSTKTPTPAAEGHIAAAEMFAASAEEWMDADEGWKAGIPAAERIMRRSCDLQAAQVHATLAQTLKAAELMPIMAALAESITPAQPETPASGDDKEGPQT